jgi:transposase InsO family protein
VDELHGLRGDQRIAQTLARAGWRIAKTTAGRYKKKPFIPLPPALLPIKGTPLQARYPHHVWIMDVTRIPALMGAGELAIAAVFDAFSRVPLAVRVFERYPLAKDTLALAREAIKSFGPPRYLASDQGEEFDAGEFQNGIKALGIKQRFDSVGKHSITARLERFWRTIKLLTNVGVQRPLVREDLDRRLHVALDYYAHSRPHQGLGGATPAEVYQGLTPASRAAVQPPRGRAGEGTHKLPFTIKFVDPEEQLPVLIRVA